MKHRSKSLILGVSLAALASAAVASPTDDLIKLDKQWGTAGMAGDTEAVAALLSDDLVAVSEEGVGGKAEQLADNEPAPAGATYDASDFQVRFLDDNTAIMTHAVSGEGQHYSMHVWSKKGGKWQVVATSSTPAASE
jgi:hypothetical protein